AWSREPARTAEGRGASARRGPEVAERSVERREAVRPRGTSERIARMHLLVTGGAGFIGSNFVRYVLGARPEWRVTNLDALTYSGNLENLRDVERDPRYRFVKGDICDGDLVRSLAREVDAIAHFAAESHVDRSIIDSQPFLRSNVIGTQTLLDAARAAGGRRFAHVSTDEVYGSLPL